MDNKRVVITGIGVIVSNGIGRDRFFESIFSGYSGIKPISLFDTSPYKVKTAGESADFDPRKFLGDKGLRTLDRSTKLLCSSVRLALDDAHLEVTAENTSQIGVVSGNTLGSLHSVCDFDIESIKEGPRYVNPALFPNTVINSPASQASIKFNIKGFNTTISTGFCASLDAIKYATDFLKIGRAKAALVSGVEELCLETFLAFYKTGFLAGLNGGPEISCPFDRRRNGIIFGEGSVVLVLEDLDSALSRQAHIYAEVLGFGMGQDAYRINKYNPTGAGLKKAMQMALRNADVSLGDIDYISAAANSTVAADAIESSAIGEVFGAHSPKIPVSAIKSMIGECFSAAGAFGVAASLGAIERQMVSPTINYQEKDARCNLNYVTNKAKACKINKVLINAFGPSGCNSCLIISKFEG